MKKVWLDWYILTCDKWYIVHSVNDQNLSEIRDSKFQYPYSDWYWLNKLKLWLKKITIDVSLRKDNNADFISELNNLKKWKIWKKIIFTLDKDLSNWNTISLYSKNAIIKNISWEVKAWMTYMKFSIEIDILDWYLKTVDVFDQTDNVTNAVMIFDLVSAGNYKVLPVIDIKYWNWSDYNIVKIETDSYYAEILPVTMTTDDILQINFWKWKIYLNWNEVEYKWFIDSIDLDERYYIKFYKNDESTQWTIDWTTINTKFDQIYV